MAQPFVQTFKVNTSEGEIELASVVIDQRDFDALCDELAAVKMLVGITLDQVAALKSMGNIPLVARGTKTDFLFQRWGVTCDRLSIIVRGKGRDVARRLAEQMWSPEAN